MPRILLKIEEESRSKDRLWSSFINFLRNVSDTDSSTISFHAHRARSGTESAVETWDTGNLTRRQKAYSVCRRIFSLQQHLLTLCRQGFSNADVRRTPPQLSKHIMCT